MLQGQLRSCKEDFIYKDMIGTSPFFAQTEQIKRSPLPTAHFFDYVGCPRPGFSYLIVIVLILRILSLCEKKNSACLSTL